MEMRYRSSVISSICATVGLLLSDPFRKCHDSAPRYRPRPRKSHRDAMATQRLAAAAMFTLGPVEVPMGKGLSFFACTALLIAACTVGQTPTAPTSSTTGPGVQLTHLGHGQAEAPGQVDNPNSGAQDDHGYIDGWFNGERVQLYYTKTFFCAEPPDSGAGSHCELGADAETAPRPGPIPTIYAIAAAGGIPAPLATLSCPPGSVCLNHPRMIDASRVGGLANGPAV